MTVVERLRETLGALALTCVEGRLESLLEQAAKNEPSYGDFLLDVLTTEVEARRQRYLKTRLQLAHLPYVKTFEQFDFSFQPSIDERQVRELRTLRFVHEASNVISAQRAPRAAWRGQDAPGGGAGRSGDPGRPAGLLQDRSRSGGRLGQGLPGRPAGPADADLPGAEGARHRLM